MFILGLTGSIGMGKTVVAGQFRQLGIPVHDADKAVHDLMAKGGGAVDKIREIFPEAIQNGVVERNILAERVFSDPRELFLLEKILHPLVRQAEQKFLRRAMIARYPLVVLDIPLLFETGGETRCDAVAVVTAPGFVQRKRVLSRPGMTPHRLAGILARQVPDVEKRRRADFIIPTGLGRAFSLAVISDIIRARI